MSAMGTTKTEAECSGDADIPFIESFIEPVCVCLRDRSIFDGLINTGAHLSDMGSLDCFLHLGKIYTFL